jgi:hypothetical protein
MPDQDNLVSLHKPSAAEILLEAVGEDPDLAAIKEGLADLASRPGNRVIQLKVLFKGAVRG